MRVTILALLSWNCGTATTFDDPAPLACDFKARSARKTAEGVALRAAGMVAAHRRLPCWTVIVICTTRTGACSRAVVADRGPYGKRRMREKDLDLLAPLAKRIGSDGYENVVWIADQ